MRRRPLHTKTETNRQEQQTGEEKDPDSYSPRVSHCKSQLAVFPPSLLPLPPILRGYQASAEGLSPADSGSSEGWEEVVGGGGGGVVRVRVGGGGGVNVYTRACVSAFGSGNQEAYTAPSDMEVRGQAERDDQSDTTAVRVCLCRPWWNNHK